METGSDLDICCYSLVPCLGRLGLSFGINSLSLSSSSNCEAKLMLEMEVGDGD